MRKFLMVTMVAGLGLGLSQSATANYFWPGKVIIVGGGSGGGSGSGSGSGGSGSNAAAMNDCPVQIECDCFEAGTPLIQACNMSTVPPECVDPIAAYDHVQQLQPVLIESANRTLGGLRCAGMSDSTAFVYLTELKDGGGGEANPPNP